VDAIGCDHVRTAPRHGAGGAIGAFGAPDVIPRPPCALISRHRCHFGVAITTPEWHRCRRPGTQGGVTGGVSGSSAAPGTQGMNANSIACLARRWLADDSADRAGDALRLTAG